MSNFGGGGGGFSPWANGTPPCFVSRDNYAHPGQEFNRNWTPRPKYNNNLKNWQQRRPQLSSPPAAKFMKLNPESVQLKVTIPGGSRGRSVSGRGKQGGTWVPRKKSNVPFVCFVCNKYFSVEQIFLAHLQSEAHVAKEKLKIKVHNNAREKQGGGFSNSGSVPKQRSAGPSSEHKAEQSNSSSPSQSQAKNHYCRDCRLNFTCNVVEHRQSEEHKKSKALSRPYCAECQWFFKTPKKYVKHCKNFKHTGWDIQEERKGGANSLMGDFVTVDAVGIYEEGQELTGSNAQGVIEPDERSGNSDEFNLASAAVVVDETYGDDGDHTADETSWREKYIVTDKDDCVEPTKAGNDEFSPLAAGDVAKKTTTPVPPPFSKDKTAAVAPAVSIKQEISGVVVGDSATKTSASSTTATSASRETAKVDTAMADQSDSAAVRPVATTVATTANNKVIVNTPPTVDAPGDDLARKPVGLSYIIPITGYFCKLCRKIFKEESVAKSTHCLSEEHIAKFKAVKPVPNKGAQTPSSSEPGVA